MAAKIYTEHGPILVATTYTRPNTHIPYADLNTLFNHNIPTYILADFNANHTAFNHNTCNRHGTQLLQITTLKNLRFLGPDFHTTYSHNGGRGRPDLALTNRLTLPFNHHLAPGPICGSDHIPVILYLSPNPIAIPSPLRLDYKKTNWTNFQSTLQDTHLQFDYEGQPSDSIDLQAERIQNTIMEAIRSHTPTTRYNIYRDFIPSHRTKRLIICYRHRYTHNQLRLHQVLWDLGILRRHILASLQQDHNEHWHNIIQHTEIHRTKNPSKFWAKIRKLKGIQTNNFDYLLINNIKIYDSSEVVEAFKQHWENIFQPHPPTQHQTILQHVRNIEQIMIQGHELTQHDPIIHHANLRHNHQNSHLITPFHADEVQTLLKHSPRRCAGPSGITFHALRHLPLNIIHDITSLYNASLACGYFPSTFKTANIRLIPKPQKTPSDPSHYRPISLLNGLGKTYERLLHSRLRTHLEINNLIPSIQFGFRPFTSTEDALNTIVSYIDSSSSTRYKSLIVTKDVAKAFDTVWHTGLKYKILHHFNLPNPLTKLLCNFLTDRRCRILHKDKFSNYFSPQAGVPQGSVLGPILYNMYTHDIPNTVHPQSLTVQYADDVTLLTRATHLDTLTARMQTEINQLTSWEHKWLIHSHPEKASATYFKTKTNVPHPLFQNTILPNPIHIPVTNTTKVLGLTIDKNLRFHYHIKTKREIARKTLSNLFRFKSASVKTKIHLYTALVFPLLSYCPLALKLSAHSNTISLQRIQNLALRWIHDTRWYHYITSEHLHNISKRPPLNIFWHHKLLKQLEKYPQLRPDIKHKIQHLSTGRGNPGSLSLLDLQTYTLPNPTF